MSETPEAIICNECKKQLHNIQQLEMHIFLNHTLPKLFIEGDPRLFEMQKCHAYHTALGECPRHGRRECLCIHPEAESTEAQLKTYCIACIMQEKRERENS